MSTEILAAAVEAELAKVETQLAQFSRSTGDSRPYEAFDFLAHHSASAVEPTSFEYDGHCPPYSGQHRAPDGRGVRLESSAATATDFSTIGDANDAVLTNRVLVVEDASTGGRAANDVAAEMEVAFRQLARLFSGDVAQQWQSAAKQLDDARAMVDELRHILATARNTLADINNLREDAQRARGGGNPACRKS